MSGSSNGGSTTETPEEKSEKAKAKRRPIPHSEFRRIDAVVGPLMIMLDGTLPGPKGVVAYNPELPGASDAEVAKVVGYNTWQIAYWRESYYGKFKKLPKPVKAKPTIKLPKETYEAFSVLNAALLKAENEIVALKAAVADLKAAREDSNKRLEALENFFTDPFTKERK